MLMSIICSVIVLLVIIGVIVYFTVYHNKDNGDGDTTKQLQKMAPIVKRSIRDYFHKEY